MDIDAAMDAFRKMVQAQIDEGVTSAAEVRLAAVPVVAADHPGDTVQVVDHDIPEGSKPTSPDALSLQLHVTGPAGEPVGGRVLEVASELGLRVGTSDLLLL